MRLELRSPLGHLLVFSHNDRCEQQVCSEPHASPGVWSVRPARCFSVCLTSLRLLRMVAPPERERTLLSPALPTEPPARRTLWALYNKQITERHVHCRYLPPPFCGNTRAPSTPLQIQSHPTLHASFCHLSDLQTFRPALLLLASPFHILSFFSLCKQTLLHS